MGKFELTATELMATLNWKKSKVYYWINAGKFETVTRETGTNVLITEEQIKRLKTETFSESSKEYENNIEISEKVQENNAQNVAKHYKTVSNSSNSLDNEFYNNALQTVKDMYQTFVQSQSYNMKLLTDGKSETQAEILELRAENKQLSQKIQKSSKAEIIKNCVIICVSVLLLISLVVVWILSNCLIKFQTAAKTPQIEHTQTIHENLKPNKSLKK